MKKACSICGRIHAIGERCPQKPAKKYKKYSEFIDNPLVVTLIEKLFKINLAVKITTRGYCNRNYL